MALFNEPNSFFHKIWVVLESSDTRITTVTNPSSHFAIEVIVIENDLACYPGDCFW